MVIIVALLVVILALIVLLSVGAVAAQSMAIASQGISSVVTTCTLGLMVFVALIAGVTLGTGGMRRNRNEYDQEKHNPRSPRITRPQQPQMPYPPSQIVFLPMSMQAPFQGVPMIQQPPQDRQVVAIPQENDLYQDDWEGWY